MALAQYLELEVKHARRKQVIKNILIDRLVDDELLDQFYLEEKVDLQDESDSAFKLKQLEIQKEMEMAKMELEKALKRQELDARLQMEKEKFQMKEKEKQERLAFEKEKFEKELEAKNDS